MKLVTELKEQREETPRIWAAGWNTVPKNPPELCRAG
jgi:hypothetical protein